MNKLLKELATAMTNTSQKKDVVLEFFQLILADGNKMAVIDGDLTIEWKAKTNHHWVILEVIKMKRDKEIQSFSQEGGRKTQGLFTQFLHAPATLGDEYNAATINCTNEQLATLITVLFELWSGGISYEFPPTSPLKFDRHEFEKDVVKGFLSHVK